MKRLVWLLLTVLCASFAQVQPVELPAPAPSSCCCGDTQACGCSLPDCAPPPAHNSLAPLPPGLAASQRDEARRISPAPRLLSDKFYKRYVAAPDRNEPVSGLVGFAPPAASVPVFKAHCSYLI